ncbi:MAG: hypothetical protein F2828_17085 [Actinobacteria bacterium]|nr:hypothetical protein [Actinomycetota bacterium]
MPLEFGKDDAELAADRDPRARRFRLRMFALVAALLVIAVQSASLGREV